MESRDNIQEELNKLTKEMIDKQEEMDAKQSAVIATQKEIISLQEKKMETLEKISAVKDEIIEEQDNSIEALFDLSVRLASALEKVSPATLAEIYEEVKSDERIAETIDYARTYECESQEQETPDTKKDGQPGDEE